MGFFNKKEDSLHIELTPHGRYLLSIGKLVPHHYKFFDDDVLYDSNHAGFDEHQNSTHIRITEETPKIRPNANIMGVETDVNKMKTTDYSLTLNLNDYRFEPRERNNVRLTKEIGTIKYDSTHTPDIKVDFFNGEINNSDKYLVSDDNQLVNIPQIDVDIMYKYKVVPKEEANNISGFTDYKDTYKSAATSIVGQGEKVVLVTPEIPIIRIKSEGSFDEIDNFEIQVFKVENDSQGGLYYQKMKFIPNISPVVNDILVDIEEQPPTTLNNEYVEYFFNLRADRDISDDDLCSTIGNLEVRNIYLDEQLQCPDNQTNVNFNLYSSEVSDDDLRGCE